MTALDTFAAGLAPGGFALYPNASLNTPYDGSSRVFEPSAVAKADAQANGWSAVHMADWWSHIAWDIATDSYWIAGGRDRQRPLAQNLVSYHAATDQWGHRPNWSGAPGGHCYQGTCVGGGRAYYNGGGIQVWDILTDSFVGTLPPPPSNVCPPYTSGLAAGWALAYAPWLGAQGSLVGVNTNSSSNVTKRLSRIYRLDLATTQWMPVFAAKSVWNNQHTLAIPSRHSDTMLVGASTVGTPLPLGVLDSAGNVSFLPVGPMNASTGGSTSSRAMVFEHPERNEWISACLSTQRFWSLPPGGSAWLDRGPIPSALVSANSVAMPTRFGAAFVKYRSGLNPSEMYAWKPGF